MHEKYVFMGPKKTALVTVQGINRKSTLLENKNMPDGCLGRGGLKKIVPKSLC